MPGHRAGQDFKVRKFTNTYDAGGVDDSVIDTGLTSYIADRDNFFDDDQEYDMGQGTKKKRSAVIEDIRNNIIARMKAENTGSQTNAAGMRNKHLNHRKELAAKIREIRNKNLLLEQDDLEERALKARSDRTEFNKVQADLTAYTGVLGTKLQPPPGNPANPNPPGAAVPADGGAAGGAGANPPVDAGGAAGGGAGGAGDGGGAGGAAGGAGDGGGAGGAAVNPPVGAAPGAAVVPAPAPAPDNDSAADDNALKSAMAMQRNYFFRLQSEVRDHGTGHGRAYSFFHNRLGKKAANSINKSQHKRQRDNLITEAKDNAKAWNDERAKYRTETFRKHYDTYDQLAMTYYQLTRSKETIDQQTHLAQTGTGRDLDAQNIQAKKDIREYVGEYDLNAVNTFIDGFNVNMETLQDPVRADQGGNTHPGYRKVTFDSLPIVDHKAIQDTESGGAAPGVEHEKTHKRMVFLSTDNKRFKLDATFQGYLSKQRQTMLDRNTTTLEADKKDKEGAEGRYLISEKNVDLMDIRKHQSKRHVRGIYLNGQFIADDAAFKEKDIAFFRQRSLKDQEKINKLRSAIRSSPFFQHVNSRTIQYYAGYAINKQYELKTLGASFDEAKQYHDQSGSSPFEVAGAAGAAPQQKSDQQIFQELRANVGTSPIYKIPKDKLGKVVAAYINHCVNDQNNPMSTANYRQDPVVQYILYDKELVQSTCLGLLSDDNKAALWAIAREIVINGETSRHVKLKLAHLPRTGELMRVGLIDELVKNNQFIHGFDKWKTKTMTGDLLNTSGFEMLKEESANRRGVGAWFARNILNLNLVNKAVEVGGMIEKAKGASDKLDQQKQREDFDSKARKEILKKDYEGKEYDKLSDADKKKVDDEVDQRYGKSELKEELDLYKNENEYHSSLRSLASTVSSSANFLGVIGGASYFFVMLEDTFTDENGKTREKGKNEFDKKNALFAINTVNSISTGWEGAKALYQLVADVIKAIQRCHKYLNPTQAEKDEDEKTPKVYAANFLAVFDEVIKISNDILKVVSSIQSLGTTWSEAGSDNATNFKFLGGLLTTVKGILIFAENVKKTAVGDRQRKRMNKADEDIETAITFAGNTRAAAAAAAAGNPPPALSPQDQEKMEMGEAAENDSQVQFFLMLSRDKAKLDTYKGSVGMATGLLTTAKGLSDLVNNPEPISAAVLTLAPKVSEFIGWLGGAIMDKQEYYRVLDNTLGVPGLSGTPEFDTVLKEETGIISSDYLVDVSRIFTAIDTHVLACKPQRSPGETALLKKALGTVYSNLDDQKVEMGKIDIADLIKLSGFDEGSDWRQVLRSSVKEYTFQGR